MVLAAPVRGQAADVADRQDHHKRCAELRYLRECRTDALLLVAGPALAAALARLWHCGPFWTDARTVRARCRFVCVSVGVRAHHGVYGGECMRRVIFTHNPPGALRERATATT